MKRTSKKGLLALLSVTLLAAAMYGGYLLGRSTLPVTIVRPHTREIFSGPLSISSTFTGSPHSDGYSVVAFIMVNGDLSDILTSIVGDNDSAYFAYVLPEPTGFHLILHHDSKAPALTDGQHDELIERVRSRLIEETIKWREVPEQK